MEHKGRSEGSCPEVEWGAMKNVTTMRKDHEDPLIETSTGKGEEKLSDGSDHASKPQFSASNREDLYERLVGALEGRNRQFGAMHKTFESQGNRFLKIVAGFNGIFDGTFEDNESEHEKNEAKKDEDKAKDEERNAEDEKNDEDEEEVDEEMAEDKRNDEEDDEEEDEQNDKEDDEDEEEDEQNDEEDDEGLGEDEDDGEEDEDDTSDEEF
ncbi:prostatic spermine-binding protein-like [Uloborus diversus]|uniref:prostatic spermine-binding protein-like n=1 Tax=Uloborus diversus TaxID=327109 RepID=UPI002409482A|nr:prostatic spermine-binding protein-like [Uloborus diversus]